MSHYPDIQNERLREDMEYPIRDRSAEIRTKHLQSEALELCQPSRPHVYIFKITA
jgi:hypothetical protein